MRILLVLAAAAVVTLAAQPPQSPSAWPGREWATANIESQGLDPAAFDKLDADVRAGLYGHVDHLFVARRGHRDAVWADRHP